jgi:hypothetical protein
VAHDFEWDSGYTGEKTYLVSLEPFKKTPTAKSEIKIVLKSMHTIMAFSASR